MYDSRVRALECQTNSRLLLFLYITEWEEETRNIPEFPSWLCVANVQSIPTNQPRPNPTKTNRNDSHNTGKMSLTDALRSIVGRAVVVHEKRDDGTVENGGNSGGPLAYGIIGIAAVPDADKNIAVTASSPVSESALCEFQVFDDTKG
jgi:hypothetical protein